MVTVGGCVVDKWGRQTDMLLLAAALRTEIGPVWRGKWMKIQLMSDDGLHLCVLL